MKKYVELIINVEELEVMDVVRTSNENYGDVSTDWKDNG